MIYLLYGADTYRSRARLKEFERRFRTEVSFSWFFVDCREDAARTFFQKEGGGPTLFAKKEFGVLKYISQAEDDVQALIERELKRWSKDDSVVIVFEEGVPAKNKLFTLAKKLATQVQEFELLTRAKCEQWLEVELKRRQGTLSSSAKQQLIERSAGDLAKLMIELDQLMLGGEGGETLDVPKDQELFLLGDLWGTRSRMKALLQYESLLRRHFIPERMLWTMLWHVKRLILASKDETRAMNPYVARKSKEQARNFTFDELVRAYDELVSLEDRIVRESLDVGLLKFFLTT